MRVAILNEEGTPPQRSIEVMRVLRYRDGTGKQLADEVWLHLDLDQEALVQDPGNTPLDFKLSENELRVAKEVAAKF